MEAAWVCHVALVDTGRLVHRSVLKSSDNGVRLGQDTLGSLPSLDILSAPSYRRGVSNPRLLSQDKISTSRQETHRWAARYAYRLRLCLIHADIRRRQHHPIPRLRLQHRVLHLHRAHRLLPLPETLQARATRPVCHHRRRRLHAQ